MCLCVVCVCVSRYKECVQLMQVLEDVGSKSGVSSATGWFYSSCFHTLLYAGMQSSELTRTNTNRTAQDRLE